MTASHLTQGEVGSFLCLMCLNARYKSNEERQNYDVFRDVETAFRASHHLSHLSYKKHRSLCAFRRQNEIHPFKRQHHIELLFNGPILASAPLS